MPFRCEQCIYANLKSPFLWQLIHVTTILYKQQQQQHHHPECADPVQLFWYISSFQWWWHRQRGDVDDDDGDGDNDCLACPTSISDWRSAAISINAVKYLINKNIHGNGCLVYGELEHPCLRYHIIWSKYCGRNLIE